MLWEGTYSCLRSSPQHHDMQYRLLSTLTIGILGAGDIGKKGGRVWNVYLHCTEVCSHQCWSGRFGEKCDRYQSYQVRASVCPMYQSPCDITCILDMAGWVEPFWMSLRRSLCQRTVSCGGCPRSAQTTEHASESSPTVTLFPYVGSDNTSLFCCELVGRGMQPLSTCRASSSSVSWLPGCRTLC